MIRILLPAMLLYSAELVAADRPAARSAASTKGGFTDADFDAHVAQLRSALPRSGQFNIVIQKPFVVIGDEPLDAVRAHARDTVKFAVDRLKRDFFSRDPDRVIDVWLFKNKPSYDKYTKEIFNDRPDTPFGYYSTRHHALIMNIDTGGGTLVHEIVHPFVRTNFPECPAWFNEGLGSLFEQSGDRNGHIWGYTNWRLAGLQEAIREGRVPMFKKLCETDDDAFYNRDKGTNYAQARYLVYYLQDKGLLVKYYHAFVAARKSDPTGYNTLKSILGESDMSAFKKKWEAFVLKLTFP